MARHGMYEDAERTRSRNEELRRRAERARREDAKAEMRRRGNRAI